MLDINIPMKAYLKKINQYLNDAVTRYIINHISNGLSVTET